MIRIEHLRKEFPLATPLKDINAEIKKGEVISIIGPSGTGKSTLLRCLNLLETPTSGQIFLDGKEITGKECRPELLRRRMGMVFQSFNLFPHMNVLENIIYAPMKLLKLSREEAEKKARELLKTVGLSDKERSYPDELSGGQKQRIAIVRTLAMNPEIILFDEPTSALDPTMVGEVLAVIRQLAGQGLTMIIVTHEMNFARSVSNRIFYMDQGEVYEQGTPDEIFEHPKRELTRQFMRQIKALHKDIVKGYFDFPHFVAELKVFAEKNMIGRKLSYALQAVMEELCVQTLLPALADGACLHYSLEYSNKNMQAEVTFEFDDLGYDPLAQMDPISKKILENAAQTLTSAVEKGSRTIRAILA